MGLFAWIAVLLLSFKLAGIISCSWWVIILLAGLHYLGKLCEMVLAVILVYMKEFIK